MPPYSLWIYGGEDHRKAFLKIMRSAERTAQRDPREDQAPAIAEYAAKIARTVEIAEQRAGSRYPVAPA
jgi:truncated hemoglobin YjbI